MKIYLQHVMFLGSNVWLGRGSIAEKCGQYSEMRETSNLLFNNGVQNRSVLSHVIVCNGPLYISLWNTLSKQVGKEKHGVKTICVLAERV